MKDPQNNTTPAQRLRMIRKTFGEKIAKKVAEKTTKEVNNIVIIIFINLSLIMTSKKPDLESVYTTYCQSFDLQLQHNHFLLKLFLIF